MVLNADVTTGARGPFILCKAQCVSPVADRNPPQAPPQKETKGKIQEIVPSQRVRLVSDRGNDAPCTKCRGWL